MSLQKSLHNALLDTQFSGLNFCSPTRQLSQDPQVASLPAPGKMFKRGSECWAVGLLQRTPTQAHVERWRMSLFSHAGPHKNHRIPCFRENVTEAPEVKTQAGLLPSKWQRWNSNQALISSQVPFFPLHSATALPQAGSSEPLPTDSQHARHKHHTLNESRAWASLTFALPWVHAWFRSDLARAATVTIIILKMACNGS